MRCLFLLALLTTVSAHGQTDAVYINPSTLVQNPNYTQVVTLPACGLIFVSGQAGQRPDGTVISAEFDAQAAQALENLRLALQAAGVTPAEIIKINTYIVDLPTHIDSYRTARRSFFRGVAHPPASTTVGVPAIAAAGALIEIEAVAYKRPARHVGKR
ncbi:MAG TPA: RidA family protein [Thermoanaerobaculia bacterium]|jgi:enamine deaminase RidA (YjgF/YER057c/UK114 family)